MKKILGVLVLLLSGCASAPAQHVIVSSTEMIAGSRAVWYGAGDVACQVEYPLSGAWKLSVWPKRTPGQGDSTTNPVLVYETLIGNQDDSEEMRKFVRRCGPPKPREWAITVKKSS